MEKSELSEEYITKVKASIVESSRDFIGIADASGKLIYLNSAAYEMLGYSKNDSPKFNTIADVHANNFDKFALEVIQPAVFEKGWWAGTGYLKHKDGSAVAVSQTVFPIYGKDGTQYGTAAVMKDISEITKMNAQIQKNNELFQKVLDSSKIGIVLINMETNTIEMVNQFAQELLQMDAGEIIGSKCYNILCHRSPDICPHVNERNIPTIVAERFLERKDGSFIPIIKTGTWITIDNKDYLVDTLVDITIQKNLEKNLFDAKIAAEAANHSKSEFLSRMSHEMRTPLNAIIGMAQIAGRTDNVEKLKAAINTIEVSSKHLLELINDILDLSKIEEGKLDLSIEPFLFYNMIQKITSLIDPKAKEKNISFSVNLDKDIPEIVVGDSMRISQALLNFLTNAVKFTPENGQILLNVSNKGFKEDYVTLDFAVTDNGIGITDQQLSRLFNPFVQAETSTSKKFGGTGLGLAISKQILGLMNSDISVKTKYGKGSSFSFTLTLFVSENISIKSDKIDLEKINNIFAGKKALIVDDVELNRIVATELLSITGISIDEAADGSEAVRKARQNHYDLIFMDIQMPIMGGYEATRQIREMENPDKKNIIIAMSANVFKEDIEQSISIGMDGHLGKPIDLQSMISTVIRLLSPKENKISEDKQKKEILFKPDYHKVKNDTSLINFQLALKGKNNNEILLAESLDLFIKNELFNKLQNAMNKNEYIEAELLIKELQKLAKELALPGIFAYAVNVDECLYKKEFEYAKMYMADLTKSYHKTCKAIACLLD